MFSFLLSNIPRSLTPISYFLCGKQNKLRRWASFSASSTLRNAGVNLATLKLFFKRRFFGLVGTKKWLTRIDIPELFWGGLYRGLQVSTQNSRSTGVVAQVITVFHFLFFAHEKKEKTRNKYAFSCPKNSPVTHAFHSLAAVFERLNDRSCSRHINNNNNNALGNRVAVAASLSNRFGESRKCFLPIHRKHIEFHRGLVFRSRSTARKRFGPACLLAYSAQNEDVNRLAHFWRAFPSKITA